MALPNYGITELGHDLDDTCHRLGNNTSYGLIAGSDEYVTQSMPTPFAHLVVGVMESKYNVQVRPTTRGQSFLVFSAKKPLGSLDFTGLDFDKPSVDGPRYATEMGPHGGLGKKVDEWKDLWQARLDFAIQARDDATITDTVAYWQGRVDAFTDVISELNNWYENYLD